MGRLDGKVAVITGSARGQGEAEARLFVAEGARVVIGDVLDEEGEAVAADLGDRSVFVHLDVTDERQWAAAVAQAERLFDRVDILVNNAGILHVRPIHKTNPDDFDRVLHVNVRGTFLGIRAVTPLMARSGGGSIVNISSTAGLQGLPLLGAYVASKWAVRGMTKTAAMELGPKGIRVNSIHPGGVDTAMVSHTDTEAPFYTRVPAGRIGTPLEIARAVLFLASDDSSYVTGTELAVDGGATSGDLGMVG